MSQIIYNGVTYEVSEEQFDSCDKQLTRLISQPPLAGSFSLVLNHEGTRHRIYVALGTPITLVE